MYQRSIFYLCPPFSSLYGAHDYWLASCEGQVNSCTGRTKDIALVISMLSRVVSDRTSSCCVVIVSSRSDKGERESSLIRSVLCTGRMYN
jgi:hypothetical protein